mmetsp:Transcript_14875/g.19888  ORF Transcript_14875/g.19888 Transcript_14875/m.19888 type:complete len:203 (-) Transcript_14875:197-805(-)
MGFVGSHEERLSGGNQKVVQEEGCHRPRIARKLLSKPENRSGRLPFPGGLCMHCRRTRAALLLPQPNKQLLKPLHRTLVVAVHEGGKEILQGKLLGFFVLCHEDGQLRLCGYTVRELSVLPQKDSDLFDAPEPAHRFERGQRDSHLRLVVRVFVVFGVLLVQSRREILVGVRLNGKGFACGKDFENEGKRSSESILETSPVF